MTCFLTCMYESHCSMNDMLLTTSSLTLRRIEEMIIEDMEREFARLKRRRAELLRKMGMF